MVPQWPTLRDALENWHTAEGDLCKASDQLNAGGSSFAFDASNCAAPLPRAFQWLDGSVYLNHAELVRKARNADMPEILYREPMVYQGAADGLLGPTDPIVLPDQAHGIDLEAEIGVVTDDVAMGVTAAQAQRHIRLVMLLNDVSLRNLMPDELSKGFGFLTSKPATAFSPVAVTPDELGAAWNGRKLSGSLVSRVNGHEIGRPDAGVDMSFDFADLIRHVAQTRTLTAGTIVGSGTVSNRDDAVGVSCLQELRMREKLRLGEMRTPLLQFGDRVEIEMLDRDGQSIFGRINQVVTQHVA